jgi:hypothetical protein
MGGAMGGIYLGARALVQPSGVRQGADALVFAWCSLVKIAKCNPLSAIAW